jgi:hypothetical protein
VDALSQTSWHSSWCPQCHQQHREIFRAFPIQALIPGFIRKATAECARNIVIVSGRDSDRHPSPGRMVLGSHSRTSLKFSDTLAASNLKRLPSLLLTSGLLLTGLTQVYVLPVGKRGAKGGSGHGNYQSTTSTVPGLTAAPGPRRAKKGVGRRTLSWVIDAESKPEQAWAKRP